MLAAATAKTQRDRDLLGSKHPVQAPKFMTNNHTVIGKGHS